MRRGEPKLEIHPEPPLRPNARPRPRLGRALAASLLIGAAFTGCAAGPEWTAAHEAERPLSPARRDELEKKSTEALGREALAAVGYDGLIALARQAGLVTKKRVEKARLVDGAGRALVGAAPADEFVEVFSKYAVVAGVTSQADSPLPGPADVAALGILAMGLIHAGFGAALVGGHKGHLMGTTAVWVPAPVATTAPPPVPPLAATSTPTAAPTTTVVVPPIAGTRRRPGQTCDDDRLRDLEKEKAAACAPQWTCKNEAEKLGKPDEKRFTCAELLARLALGEACLAARRLVQTECYAGSPDKGHDQLIEKVAAGVEKCLDKVRERKCR